MKWTPFDIIVLNLLIEYNSAKTTNIIKIEFTPILRHIHIVDEWIILRVDSLETISEGSQRHFWGI